jgi:hypothetical protein
MTLMWVSKTKQAAAPDDGIKPTADISGMTVAAVQ